VSKTSLAVVAVTAAASLLGTSAAASAATNPVVSKETTSGATRAPLTIPGTGVKKGARLPRGDRLMFRTVTLEKGQTVEFTMRAPRGMTLRGLAPGGRAVGFSVVRPVHYPGRRAVTVRAFVPSNAKAGTHTARIWALVS
jgi:hypothetical protein